MSDVTWYGLTLDEKNNPESGKVWNDLALAAKTYRWEQVFNLLETDHYLVNSTRAGGRSLYAPLHQAAYGGASTDIVSRLLTFGAWRTLENARGERPIDVAERMGHEHLRALLTPDLKHSVPFGVLLKIQANFHKVIRSRFNPLIDKYGLRLPELSPILELDEPKMWFQAPGMHGGFSYWFESFGPDAVLTAESWCRVAEGSGQRHEINSREHKLVAEGFV
jgi:hypothetical protein